MRNENSWRNEKDPDGILVASDAYGIVTSCPWKWRMICRILECLLSRVLLGGATTEFFQVSVIV